MSVNVKQLLNVVIAQVYSLNGDKLTNFSIRYDDSLKYAGRYDIESRTIWIGPDNSGCDEVILATCLHELTHHIQYQTRYYTTHDEDFRDTQRKLLYAAFQLNKIDPSKLYLACKYLSNIEEREIVANVCEIYLRRFPKTQKYKLVLSSFADERDRNGYSFCSYKNLYFKFERSNENRMIFLLNSKFS